MVKLSKRLQLCADLVRRNVRLADIGCDHGYVPVYLVDNDYIISAVASDINEGPLNSCRQLVREYHLDDRIKCVLSDGLNNINSDMADDILIAGMGGELIADILSRCTFVKEKHLIINPMTHAEIARKWLFDNGFEICNDIVFEDAGHHYSVFDAYYKGEAVEYEPLDCYIGKVTDFSDKEYFIHLINYLKNKQKSGADFNEIIAAIERKIQ